MSLILSKRVGNKDIYMTFSTAFGSRYHKIISVGVDEESGFGSLPAGGFTELPVFERASESARYGDFKRYSYTLISTGTASFPSGANWEVTECVEEEPAETYCEKGEYSFSAGTSLEFRKCSSEGSAASTGSYRCRGFGSSYVAGAGGDPMDLPPVSVQTEQGSVADPDLGVITYRVEETVCGVPGQWIDISGD